MHRAIAVAALALGIAIGVFNRAHVPGTFLEPALLALVGTFLLVAARFASPGEPKDDEVPLWREAKTR